MVDLANFLIAMGAKIHGAGTDKIIVIQGVEAAARHDATRCCPTASRAAPTWWPAPSPAATCASRTRGPDHLDAVLAKLAEAGAKIGVGDNWIEVDMRGRRPKAVDVRTAPYPAFPTDMQAQFAALNTVADGVGTIIETIFENRFMHMLEMRRLGAEIRLEGNTAIIHGRRAS